MFNLQWSISSRRCRPLGVLLGLRLVVNRSGSEGDGNSLISRCLLMEDKISSKLPFRQAAAAACCWASLGGLTNKAGMSFSFRGMMLATPRSMKDSR